MTKNPLRLKSTKMHFPKVVHHSVQTPIYYSLYTAKCEICGYTYGASMKPSRNKVKIFGCESQQYFKRNDYENKIITLYYKNNILELYFSKIESCN
jgi:hypothetical protein